MDDRSFAPEVNEPPLPQNALGILRTIYTGDRLALASYVITSNTFGGLALPILVFSCLSSQ
jgi:hypothetical protein